MAPRSEKSLKDMAAGRTQLGDPVSLKAETSNTEPTEHDRPNKTPEQGGKSLKELAQQKMETNPTQLGDPVSLKAETSNNQPTDQDRGALSDKRSSNNNGKPKI